MQQQFSGEGQGERGGKERRKEEDEVSQKGFVSTHYKIPSRPDCMRGHPRSAVGQQPVDALPARRASVWQTLAGCPLIKNWSHQLRTPGGSCKHRLVGGERWRRGGGEGGSLVLVLEDRD